MMKAIFHEKKAGLEGLRFGEMEEREPGKGEVKIKIKVAGLNHRDLFVLYRHNTSEPPLILGSDGAGIVESVGTNVTNVRVGDEVIINPGLGWLKISDAPPKGFEILGLPDHGTFGEYVIVPSENVYKRPEHLSWEEAGVFSLSALTAYRALFTKGKIEPNMNVLIPGIGSGVATFLLQFAKAVGANTFVTSRYEEKRKKAIQLGADKAIDTSINWESQLDGVKMDLVIESIGAATFNQSLKQLRPGGTIVTFGASAGDEVTFNIREFFYGQFNLLGTTMGSGEEYEKMLNFVNEHKIKPVIDRVFTFQQYKEAFSRLENGEQFGKIAFVVE